MVVVPVVVVVVTVKKGKEIYNDIRKEVHRTY